MIAYLEMINHVLNNGTIHDDRTGTGTKSVFGYQFRHNLGKGFPLLTTKRMSFRLVAVELFWMLSGSTNVKELQEQKCKIWDEWADKNGELGPVYGHQWRNFNGWDIENNREVQGLGVDQISELIDTIRNNPNSRRHIVTSWNPSNLHQQNLPPCHCFFQVKIEEGRWLSLQLYQRSADLFLGVPFNIASYALLTHLLAHVTGYSPKDLIITFGDLHIYKNHMDQVQEQLQRSPKLLPSLWLKNETPKNIFQINFDHLMLRHYESHPRIKGDVSV